MYNFLMVWDNVASWILVALCLWLVHVTADDSSKRRPDFRGRLGFFLMRFGLAALGFCLAVVTTFRMFDVVFIAGGIWKTALIVILVGVAVFHKQRFNKT